MIAPASAGEPTYGEPDAVAAAAPLDTTAGTAATLVRAGASYGVAIGAATLLNALFQVAVARLLPPSEYSLLITLFAIVLVLGVPALAVQTAAAREVAERLAAGDEAAAGGFVLAVALRLLGASALGAAAAAVGGFFAAPVLHIHHPWPLAWTAVTVVCGFELAVVYGGLQGTQRIAALSLAQVGQAGAKIAVGLVVAAIGFGVGGVMCAVAVATAATLVVAAAPLRGLLRTGRTAVRRARTFGGYTWGVAASLALFSALTAADVVVARLAFAPRVAGAYAAASVVARALLVVPTAATTVLFPRVATLEDAVRERRHLLGGLAATAVVGVVAAGVLALVPRFLLETLFGHGYVRAANWLALLALAMTLYALGYVYLFHFLALGRIGYVFVAGPIVAIQFALYALMHARPLQLVALQIGAALALVVSSELYDRTGRAIQETA